MLKDEQRREWLKPEKVLAEAGIRSGQTVVDVGAGTGFWTEALSALVGPAGHVYSVDIEPVMLEELRTMVREIGLKNVEVIQSQETSIPLPSSTADSAVLALVLHHPAEPLELLREIIRLLKPDGRLLVVDWEDRPTEHGPPLEHRISREEAHALLGAAGLTVKNLASPSEDVYALLAWEFDSGHLEVTGPTV